jgi:3-methyladenine DNA glycosylase AlkD
MSMNFAREQSLLRQRLQSKAQPGLAAARQQQHGGSQTWLGADDAEVAAAATALAAAYPQMGRAQMTAFVRTLWGSRIHELRAVGAQLLAARAQLVEPADLPLLETFLRDDATDAVQQQLARDVVGALVVKNKKLWKELKRFTATGDVRLQRAAVRAAQQPLAHDADAFARFADLVEPLLASPDAAVQTAIDDVLVAAAELHGDAVRAFVQQHQRRVVVPTAKPAATPATPRRTAAAAPAAKAGTGTAGGAVRKAAKGKPKPAAAKPRAKAPAKAEARGAKRAAKTPSRTRGV